MRAARRPRSALMLTVAFVTVAALGVALPTSAAVDTTERVSVSSAGVEGDAASTVREISGSGRYVAFQSIAANLVAGDGNAVPDIFVHDRVAGDTTRVSVDSNGIESDAQSSAPAISADGKVVAFASSATNLVAGDGNAVSDIFVHDRDTGDTSRVSVDANGVEGDASSFAPALSSSGRFVAFESDAANLVAGDGNFVADIFVHDRQTGDTTRVSVDSNGNETTSGSSSPAISGDGSIVAFRSDDSTLVGGDGNGSFDVFVHDLETGETTMASVNNNGTEGDLDTEAPDLTPDGRLVAFESSSTNLVADDNNGVSDIFVHDRDSGDTSRVTMAFDGTETDQASDRPVLSEDGRFVAFDSTATNLVPGDVNGVVDVFVVDRQTSTTTRVSIASDGTEGDAGSGGPSLSESACDVAYQSDATNLVSADGNGFIDVFVSTVDPTSCNAPFYVMVDTIGTVYAFPDERHVGDAPVAAGTSAVDIVINPLGTGYYVLDSSGMVHAIGPDSTNQGNLNQATLNPGERPSAMSLSESGDGYWIFTNLGKAAPFGDATDIGDVSDLPLVGEIVDAAPFPPGFYMVGRDGGVFTPPQFLGSQQVPFFGSVYDQLGDTPLNQPIVTIYVDAADGKGYSMAAGDGGMFNFESEFCGSIPGILPNTPLNRPVVNAVPYGDCYIFFAADGGAFVFGDQPFLGSLGDNPPANDIVSGDAFAT